MNDYRVKVNSWVVVKARDQKDALAKAELALRKAVEADYREDHNRWGELWEGFGFQATGKAQRVTIDEG